MRKSNYINKIRNLLAECSKDPALTESAPHHSLLEQAGIVRLIDALALACLGRFPPRKHLFLGSRICEFSGTPFQALRRQFKVGFLGGPRMLRQKVSAWLSA